MTASAAKQGIDIVNSIEMFKGRITEVESKRKDSSINCLGIDWVNGDLKKEVCDTLVRYCKSQIKKLENELERL